MKKLMMALTLLLLWGCAGKKYGVTEGPFRAKFSRPFHIQYVNKPWKGNIFFDGVLPEGPVHVEGYLDNNGTQYYQFHADMPEIRSRYKNVKNTFTPDQYCEATGRPMDRFSADDQFWNRGLPTDPNDAYLPVQDFAATGQITIRFKFFTLIENRQGDWVRGKILTEAKTVVKLECPMCRCGGNLR